MLLASWRYPAWCWALVILAVLPVDGRAASKPHSAEAEAALVKALFSWDVSETASYSTGTAALQDVRTKYPNTLEEELAYTEVLRIRWLEAVEWAKVLTEYQQWLAQGPSPAAQGRALKLFGDVSREGGNLAEAEGLYVEAIRMQGSHFMAAGTYTELAKIYLRTGRVSQGMAVLKDASDMFAGTPMESEVRRQWAKAVDKYGSPVAGASVAQQVQQILEPIRLASDTVTTGHARLNLAEVMQAIGRRTEAIAILEPLAGEISRGLYGDQEWAGQALQMLTYLLLEQNRHDDTIAWATRQTELFPKRDRAPALCAIAYALREKGSTDEAIAVFREVLALGDKGNVEYRAGAQFQIADMLYRREQFVEAQVEFRRVLSDFPGSSWEGPAKGWLADLEQYFARKGEAR